MNVERDIKTEDFVRAAIEEGGQGAVENSTVRRRVFARASAEALVSGDFAPAFWGLVVGYALAAPVVCVLVQVAMRCASHAVGLVGTLSALAGGCALRFAVLYAGMHADPVLDAVVRPVS